MKKAEELEHGDLVELDSAKKFVELQNGLQEDLSYLIVATKLEDGNTVKAAAAIVSIEESLSYSEVVDAYTVKAMEKYDWIMQDDEDSAEDIVESDLADALEVAARESDSELAGLDMDELKLETTQGTWKGSLELTRHK